MSRNGNTQIQVVQKVERNNKILKHFGTARNSLELKQLSSLAQQFIDEKRIRSGKVSLFDSRYSQSEMVDFFSRLSVLGAYESITFHFFYYFYKLLGFNSLSDDCFRDLVIARIVHPVSKVRTREWLEDKFGILHKYSLAAVFRALERTHRLNYQEKLEQLAWEFANETLSGISVLFFDVTTLYYEAFDEDDLRKFGFSKDHKENQPQLVIALTVTAEGIPLHVKVFAGNKFEGHTMVPCMQEIIAKHNLKDFVAVADSAMVSAKNMDELEKSGLKYIVGARLGNLPKKIFDNVIENSPKVEGSLRRFDLSNGRALIVGYSTRRAHKDKTDRKKALRRAEYALQNPSLIAKKYKFLKKAGSDTWELNQINLDKATKLEGLKGYVTNALELTNEDIASKYGDLWQVEKTFRMSKSDLKARPIFHTVKEKIEAHITIVFAGLVIGRIVEIKSGKTLRRAIEILEKVKEVLLHDPVSDVTFSKYSQSENPEVQALLKLAKINWVT